MVRQVQVGFVNTGGFFRHIAHVHDHAEQIPFGVLPNGHTHVQANAVIDDLNVFFAVALNRQTPKHQKAPAVFQFIAVDFQLVGPLANGEIFPRKMGERQPFGFHLGQSSIEDGQHFGAQRVHPRGVTLQVPPLPDRWPGHRLLHDQTHDRSLILVVANGLFQRPS